MGNIIISYSRTGNNLKLANVLSEKINAKHIKVTEVKKRNYFTIGLDMLFNIIPKINNDISSFSKEDQFIIIGPIWMGIVAAPLRAILRQLKKMGNKYSFITISGGVDGGNQKVAYDIEKRVGRSASMILEFCIADLIKKKSDNIRDEVQNYKLTDYEIKKMTEEVINKMEKDK